MWQTASTLNPIKLTLPQSIHNHILLRTIFFAFCFGLKCPSALITSFSIIHLSYKISSSFIATQLIDEKKRIQDQELISASVNDQKKRMSVHVKWLNSKLVGDAESATRVKDPHEDNSA